MRQLVKDFVRIVANTQPIYEPIYEFGALQVPGQEGFADLRPIFGGKQYIGCDMREGPGVDRILDLHNLDLPSESVGTVVIVDTLEHVELVGKAIQEIYRVLRPDGILVVTSAMDFPIHDYPYDYWRFTPEGLRSQLKIFASSFVDSAGDEHFPHTIVGIGFKGSRRPEGSMNDFIKEFEAWKRYWSGKGRAWKLFVKLFAPPILLELYRTSRRLLLQSRAA